MPADDVLAQRQADAVAADLGREETVEQLLLLGLIPRPQSSMHAPRYALLGAGMDAQQAALPADRPSLQSH
jgi:hypothetical protein